LRWFFLPLMSSQERETVVRLHLASGNQAVVQFQLKNLSQKFFRSGPYLGP
jgi:hypothetical protein